MSEREESATYSGRGLFSRDDILLEEDEGGVEAKPRVVSGKLSTGRRDMTRKLDIGAVGSSKVIAWRDIIKGTRIRPVPHDGDKW